MSNFSKIVIVILVVLTFFFVKEKFGSNIVDLISSVKEMPNVELPKKTPVLDDEPDTEVVRVNNENPSKQEEKNEKDSVSIYFLALDSNDNGIYKKVQREVPNGEDKLKFALQELLKGPNLVEKSTGAYSEVPKTTKLLNVKHTNDKIVIDLSSDFQYGGGTDSIYSRMMQLIKTAIMNTDNKKIYLYLDGKQVNLLGGEGIMITQPLTEKSLEI
jgi:spore germination protein GerM